MKGRKTVPLPPLQMDKILRKSQATYTAPKVSEPPSSISSAMQSSNEDITIDPKIPEPSLTRPKTLFSLLSRNRRTQSPASSELFSETGKDTPEGSKAADIDSQRVQQIAVEDQVGTVTEEPRQELELILQPLYESEELKSEGEFTHQSDVSNVFHVEKEEKPLVQHTPSSEEHKEATPAESEQQSVEPELQSESEVISSETDEPLHSFGSPMDSPKESSPPDPQTHVKVLSRQGTFFKRREASSSTLGSADHAPDLRNSSLPRMRTFKSVHSHHSQPFSDSTSDKREEAFRKELEEYITDRGEQVSLQVRELFDNFLLGSSSHITELDLSNSSLVDRDIVDVCQLMQAMVTLEVVNLSDNALEFQFEDQGVELYRRNQTKVKAMWLSRNPVGNGHVSKVFVHFLLCHVNLQELKLDGCGIMDGDLALLATHFEYLRVLKRINLRDNLITDKGARAVLRILKNSEEIEQVHLSGNRLTPRAWVLLKGFEAKVDFDTETKCCCTVY